MREYCQCPTDSVAKVEMQIDRGIVTVDRKLPQSRKIDALWTAFKQSESDQSAQLIVFDSIETKVFWPGRAGIGC